MVSLGHNELILKCVVFQKMQFGQKNIFNTFDNYRIFQMSWFTFYLTSSKCLLVIIRNIFNQDTIQNNKTKKKHYREHKWKSVLNKHIKEFRYVHEDCVSGFDKKIVPTCILMKIFLPKASFDLQFLLLPVSVCLSVCVSVCLCVYSKFVHIVTHYLFKPVPPNWVKRCKTHRPRSLLFGGLINLFFQCQI